MCRILPRFRGGDRTLSLEFVVVELDGAGQMSIPVVLSGKASSRCVRMPA
jgi:hypothetical protein